MFKKIFEFFTPIILLLIATLLLHFFGCYYVVIEKIPADDDGKDVVSMRFYP
jgi:hypothetical protein